MEIPVHYLPMTFPTCIQRSKESLAGCPVRALSVCTNDVTGGAAIAAYRLHEGLRRIGVASSMLVASKASADPDVHEIRRDSSSLARLIRRFQSSRIAKDIGRYSKTLSPTLELLSDDRVAGPADLTNSRLPADVYQLHWVAGFLDYKRFFGSLPLGAPLVWTLHDMNPFTGGCHYAMGCEKYMEHCGACPQLGSGDPSDLTAQIHARKSASLGRLLPETTKIVAPSHWMTGQAKASTLLRGFDVMRIPNGLDTDVFQPRDRKEARDRFGLPQNAKVVMIVAHYLTNHRKGFDLLTAALDGLSAKSPVVLASAGVMDRPAPFSQLHVPLGKIGSERLMSYALSAADVFVCPTRADNLPNVVLEAMACGTPVVGFDVGGVADMVRTGETGILVTPEDVGGLRNAIETVLYDDELKNRFSTNCRQAACDEFRLEIQARRYLAIYEELIESSLRLEARQSLRVRPARGLSF